MNREKQKHKSIYVGVAALRSALVERGQSLRRVKCFPVVKGEGEKSEVVKFISFSLLLCVYCDVAFTE